MNGRNVYRAVNVFASQIFLILNYRYCHNDNARQIFPPKPKYHNDITCGNFSMGVAP